MTQETFEQMVERLRVEADKYADDHFYSKEYEYAPGENWNKVRDQFLATRIRDELAKVASPAAPADAVAKDAALSLMCPKCGADRFKEECKGIGLCVMFGEYQAAMQGKESGK